MSKLISKITSLFSKKSEYVYFPHLKKSYLVDDLKFWMTSHSGYRLFVTPDGREVCDNGNVSFEIFWA